MENENSGLRTFFMIVYILFGMGIAVGSIVSNAETLENFEEMQWHLKIIYSMVVTFGWPFFVGFYFAKRPL